MIESNIYGVLSIYGDLLDLVGTGIFPTIPTEDTALPFLVYTVSSAAPVHTLFRPSVITQYTVDVDVWAVNLTQVLAIMMRVSEVLNGWRDPPEIKGSFLVTQGTQETDTGFTGNQSYTVWATV